jgi:peptide/nickel transport system permease protein
LNPQSDIVRSVILQQTCPEHCPSDSAEPSPEMPVEAAPQVQRDLSVWTRVRKNVSARIGAALVMLIVLIGVSAPLLTAWDPAGINPGARNRPPGYETTIRDDDGNKVSYKALMGTDTLGRDIYTRVLYGARVSLIIGISVAALSVVIGLALGVAAGYFRWLDGLAMRFMDGLMAIPAILLAIVLISLFGAGLTTVIVAITIPQVPTVVRLVRSIVLTIREEPYVEAAISVGTPTAKVLWRHVLPNTFAPLIVQATFLCGSAILLEAILSFLGVGMPSEVPTWGNIIADGRSLFQLYPHMILFPGIFLAVTVLAINMLGDGLRDSVDPRMSKKL